MRELPVITWVRDAQGKLTSVSDEVHDVLGYSAAEVLDMERRRHTLMATGADGFDAVLREEMARRGQTAARMFVTNLVHRNGAIIPAVLCLVFVREGGHYARMQAYGCALEDWVALPECCRDVMDRLAEAVGEEYEEVVRLAAAA